MRKISPDFLCDWVTCSQIHDYQVPMKSKSVAKIFDTESGELIGEAPRGFQHSGSFDTNILVTSHGNRVSVSGNVGKFGRPDNVFGYGVDDCKNIINDMLESLDLPPFTDGKRVVLPPTKSRDEIIGYTGAKFSRLDYTKNFCTGSSRNASDFIYWLSTQRAKRGLVDSYPNTVYYNKKSDYATLKIYNKAVEFSLHYRKKCRSESLANYQQTLYNWLEHTGLVRFEFVMKRKYLNESGLKYWAVMTDRKASEAYEKGFLPVNERLVEYSDIDSLTPAQRGIFHAYMRGENLLQYGWSASTFSRYRKALLKVGIDIRKELNVSALNVQVRTIELSEVVPPDFYNNYAA